MKAADIDNPAWEYIESSGIWLPKHNKFLGGDLERWPDVVGLGRDFDWSKWVDHRRRVTSRWAWAVPDPKVLDFIVEILDGRPLVEIGAGNGYWAYLLTQLGVDVLAFDRAPIGRKNSWFKLKEGKAWDKDVWPDDVHAEEFFQVQKGGTKKLLTIGPERVLFLCWPNYDTDFAFNALKRFQGDTVIYIGEGAGGCTGDDKFHQLLGYEPWRDEDQDEYPAQEWESDQEHDVLQWEGIHDHLFVYRRIS